MILENKTSCKDRTQVQQKRYRYTDKERDDSSGLSYYGARYLAPWLTRWISPDVAFELKTNSPVEKCIVFLKVSKDG
jgi:RHS repeat-associated protein